MWMFWNRWSCHLLACAFLSDEKVLRRIKKDYDVLMRGVQRIAEGDLDTMITEDIGVFEPFKEQAHRDPHRI